MSVNVLDSLYNTLKKCQLNTFYGKENSDIDIFKICLHGSSLLIKVIENQEPKLCEFIVGLGISINAQSVYKIDDEDYPYEGETINPLALAVYINDYPIIDCLLKHGAIIDTNMPKTCNYVLEKSVYRIDDENYYKLFMMVIEFATVLDLRVNSDDDNDRDDIYSFKNAFFEKRNNSIKRVPALIPDNCNLTTIYMSQQVLFCEGLCWVIYIIKRCPKIFKLVLRTCELYVEHISYLFEKLNSEHNLSKLKLRNNNLSDEAAPLICKWILGNKTIVNVGVDSNYMSESWEKEIAKTTEKLKRDVKTMLLFSRRNESCLFYRDYLPLDLFKIILELADIYVRTQLPLKKIKCEG